MLARLQPGFLLLFWCGIAATIVALPLAAPAPPGERSAVRRRLASVALDVLAFPLLYAVALEAIGRADLLTGAALGAAHALLALLFAAARHPAPATRRTTGERLRAFLARTLYGTIFAFLYLVPAP